jgi:hypothetical protein
VNVEGYKVALEQLSRLAETFEVNGKIEFPQQESSRNITALKLGIHWLQNSEMFPQGCFICSDQASNELLGLVLEKEDLGAWELCEQIGAHRLAINDDVPAGVRMFVAMLLNGHINKPKSRKRTRTWLRAQFIFTLFNLAHLMGGLNRTRNPNKIGDKFSAPDAVFDVLAPYGLNISFRAIQEICTGSKLENVKMREEHMEWIEAVEAAKKTDLIAMMTYQGLTGAYWNVRWPKLYDGAK